MQVIILILIIVVYVVVANSSDDNHKSDAYKAGHRRGYKEADGVFFDETPLGANKYKGKARKEYERGYQDGYYDGWDDINDSK